MSGTASKNRGRRPNPTPTPPHSAEAERLLIGELMHSPGFIDDVAAVLRPDDFYDASRGEMFRAILAVAQAGKPVSRISVEEELNQTGTLAKVGGPDSIVRAFESVPYAMHPIHHAKLIAEKSVRRRIIYRTTDLLATAWNETVATEDVLTQADGLGAHLTGRLPEPFTAMTGAELDASDARVEYLVDGLLVRGQPCIVAGGKKCLKTNQMIDLAVSLALGVPFLGRFNVPRAVRVGMMSGESGQATIQETARRIACAKGRALASVTEAVFCFSLPTIGVAAQMAALRRFITSNRLEVLILDPAYLCLPLGNNDAGNLFAVGALLAMLTALGQETGVTIILCHHTRKAGADPFIPPELEDIAWAGFQEFARQWLLLGRRKKYDPERGGSHRLWLNVGGSAGHSSLWAVDIEEGVPTDEGGRRWEVAVSTAAHARAEAAEVAASEQDQRREKKRQEQQQRACERVLRALAGIPDGATKSRLRDASGLQTEPFRAALAELLDDRRIEICDVTGGNKQRYDGYRITREQSGESSRDEQSRVTPHTPGILPL